jgi:hypothetical protein
MWSEEEEDKIQMMKKDKDKLKEESIKIFWHGQKLANNT